MPMFRNKIHLVAAGAFIILFLLGCYLNFFFEYNQTFERKFNGRVVSFEKVKASPGAFLTSSSIHGYQLKIMSLSSDDSQKIYILFVSENNLQGRVSSRNEVVVGCNNIWFGFKEKCELIEAKFISN